MSLGDVMTVAASHCFTQSWSAGHERDRTQTPQGV